MALAAVAAISAVAPSASAISLEPAGWTRGSGTSTFYGWNGFSFVSGPNAPDAGSYPALPSVPYIGAPTPNAYDAGAPANGAFIPGSGNIYSPSGIIQGRIEIPGYNTGSGSITTILLQVRTQGSEPQNFTVGTTEGVRLTYPGSGGNIYPVAQEELSRIALGGFGGFQVDRAYVFNVPTDPASLTFYIDAASSSMSFDAVRVDTLVSPASAGYADTGVVPEPGSIAAAGVAGLGLLARRRRAKP
jgi:hypothetical protein